MSEFVEVTIPSFLTSFRSHVEGLRAEILTDTSKVLRKEEEASIRARWYLLGRTLRSLEENTGVEGNRAFYRLFPTAPHAAFGEYGTGQRGSQTGRPAPRGWKYGQKPGMAARRYSRVAVEKARPRIISVANDRARQFARNVTVR